MLSIDNLRIGFSSPDGVIPAVKGISLEIGRGETLAIVGESGSGKSVTALASTRLLPSPPAIYQGGSITFEGQDLLSASDAELRKVRGGKIAYIFQEPSTSLNPVYSIRSQMAEMIQLHRPDVTDINAEIIRWLDAVGIVDPATRLNNYPHQLSGGMQQRVMIAMALSARPDLLIADEPTTALDVTIQKQILDKLRELQRDLGMAVMLITHAMGVVAENAQRVAVMYAGQVVEEASVEALFATPRHPYTQGLIRSIPRVDRKAQARERLEQIPGTVPSLLNPPKGCRFAERCRFVSPPCLSEPPPLREIAPGHKTACIL